MAFIEVVTVVVYLLLCDHHIYGVWTRQHHSIRTSQHGWNRVGWKDQVVHNTRLVGENKTRERSHINKKKKKKRSTAQATASTLFLRCHHCICVTARLDCVSSVSFSWIPLFVSDCYEHTHSEWTSLGLKNKSSCLCARSASASLVIGKVWNEAMNTISSHCIEYSRRSVKYSLFHVFAQAFCAAADWQCVQDDLNKSTRPQNMNYIKPTEPNLTQTKLT
jgi:hypothetical protein